MVLLQVWLQLEPPAIQTVCIVALSCNTNSLYCILDNTNDLYCGADNTNSLYCKPTTIQTVCIASQLQYKPFVLWVVT